MNLKRAISISIHDYNRNKLVDIYNSNTQSPGQAYNIYTEKDASGYKELRFVIPCKILLDDEIVENHRVQYLKNEHLVSITEKGTRDWYYISSPNISHDKKE